MNTTSGFQQSGGGGGACLPTPGDKLCFDVWRWNVQHIFFRQLCPQFEITGGESCGSVNTAASC